MTEPPTDCVTIYRMPNPRAPPAPADLPSAKQQRRRRQAGQAELAQAARRAAHQLQQRLRRTGRKQDGKRKARNPPQTGPTASGENLLLPQTRPAASICWIDELDRRALPRLTGESPGPGTPMDLTVRRRQHDPTPPLPLPSLPLLRVPDRTPPISTTTGPPKPPPTGSPPKHALQPADHPQATTTTPTATTVEGITALPHQACFPPAQTADPQGDRPCPGGTRPRRPRHRKVKRTRTGKRIRQYVRSEGTPRAWEPYLGRGRRRPRRSGQSGPQPGRPAVCPPTGQPPSGTPQPGSPHEKPQGTTASSHNTAEDTAPARTPVPAQIAKDMPEDVCDGVEYEEWVEDNPYGRGPQATRLPRPESLCWRCGVPGHSRAPVVLFCSRCGASAVPAVRPPPATTPPSPSLTPARWQPQTFRYPRHIYRRTVSV
ncbi:synapsin-1-like [Tenebrio molitor]|uniref:synapsin-1-like n=1 Tax=Tenebrio molitor TaxID=7067 RepID=UPI0036247905